ncbi:LytTR family transcriptional regulator DNA-binding domain-containing protein [Oceanicaulis sp.]|uniref:LytTR family DNA-binding domain-containing protein n=1 Tax=Oceanicaulis sp. TaxID=1924941 RepID=UPI003D26986D
MKTQAHTLLHLALALLIWLAVPIGAHARQAINLSGLPMVVCPVEAQHPSPPAFDASRCEPGQFYALDPQGRDLWARLTFTVDQDWIDTSGPKGVFISGLAASELYLNGVMIGANGQPGADRASEVPGRIDFAAHAPRDLFVAGENTLDLRLSGHHGFLTLTAPMQGLFLDEYGSPTAGLLSYYWPGLIMLGVFILGVMVFLAMAARSEDREAPIILAVMSASLGAQLLIETSRGLVSYPYPLHDARLIGIVLGAYLFSLSLIAYGLKEFSSLNLKRRLSGLAGAALVLLAPVALARGFDGKTWATLALTFGLVAFGAAYAALKGKRDAWPYAAGFSVAMILAVFTQSRFIDLHLYWLGALFLIALFIRQALSLIREQARRRAETRRAEALDAALALAQQASEPAVLTLESAGRTDYVRTEEIIRIQGAGDYVDVVFADGRTVLYTLTLTALEGKLPAAFLRVHRSHIVNTAHVERLEREPGGGGHLVLTTGAQAPVSRRIMPKVRSALSQTSLTSATAR